MDRFTSCTINSDLTNCFDKLTEEQKTFLNANSVLLHYQKGNILFRQGGLSTQIMVVEKGLVKAYIEEGNNALVLKVVTENNILGLSSLCESNNTYQYSVMAYIDSEIRQIDIKVFRQLIADNADFSKEVINILSLQNIIIYGRFFSLTYKQTYGRLADILLCLADRVFKNNEFELPLSRKELGELSGMTGETVIRILKKFREEGLVNIEGTKFKVVDYQRLKQISITG